MALVICRDALKHRESQKSYQEHGFKDDLARIASFSTQMIGQFGDTDDLMTLRTLCDDEALGREALDAIKKIEDRIRYRQQKRRQVHPDSAEASFCMTAGRE